MASSPGIRSDTALAGLALPSVRLRVVDPAPDEREQNSVPIRARREGVAATERSMGSRGPVAVSGGGSAALMARLDSGIVAISRSGALGHQVEPEPALAAGAFLLASPSAQTATRFCRKLPATSSPDCCAH